MGSLQIKGTEKDLQVSVMCAKIKTDDCVLLVTPNLLRGEDGGVEVSGFEIRHFGIPTTQIQLFLVELFRHMAERLERENWEVRGE